MFDFRFQTAPIVPAPMQFPAAPAGSPGRFGLELTFTCERLIELARDENGPEYKVFFDETLEALVVSIKKADPSVEVAYGPLDKHGYKQIEVTIPRMQNLQLFIHSDDWVIEVGSSPMTLPQLLENETYFQQLLFGSMCAVGLLPHPRVGGGHLHLEYSTHFGDNTLLLMNFLVDICNRPLLFLGGLSLDLLNAPPLAILPESQQIAFTEVVNEFHALAPAARDTEALKKEMNERVYCKSYIQRNVDELASYNKKQRKYQVINLLHWKTLEIRGLRPEVSTRALITLMQLFEGRLNKVCF
jgi:hypothetical protein